MLKLPVLLGPFLLSASSLAADRTGEPIELCHYKVVFADEFDDESISAWNLQGKRWIAHTPWAGDFGDAVFADPGPDGPFLVADGKLRITASRSPDGRWRSGLIAAADGSGKGVGTRFGYFEARMKLPPGPGTWPAFWLMSLQPAHGPPTKVEIDAIEYYGHDDASFQSAWHVWFESSPNLRNRGGGTKIGVTPGSLVSEYHDYGVLVGPDTTLIYLDRKVVGQMPTPHELYTPLYPLVDLALGSGYSIDQTPNPSVLLVDHVRVYERGTTTRSNC